MKDLKRRSKNTFSGKFQIQKRKLYLPQIHKLHKELLFIEWRAQINQADKATTKTSKKSNEIIQSMCDQLFKTKLLKENTSDVFSGTKEVDIKWRQRAVHKRKL